MVRLCSPWAKLFLPVGLVSLVACSKATPTALSAAPTPCVTATTALFPAPTAPGAVSASGAPETKTEPPEPPPEGMPLVPAGTFRMGTNNGGQQDEKPEHEVTLKAFYLDATEVTNEAYEQCVNQGICRAHDPASAHLNKLGEDHAFREPKQPVSAISWDDAHAYCHSVGKRLPTEAEWEHAARDDDGRRYPWGNETPTHEYAVFGEPTTAEVGSRSKGKGPYGHMDLAGNVWEWVEDYYDPYAYRRAGAEHGVPGTCEEITSALNELKRNKLQGFTGTNPIPSECERVLRGGAFNYGGPGLRSSNRVHHPGRFRLVMSGFRCAKNKELR